MNEKEGDGRQRDEGMSSKEYVSTKELEGGKGIGQEGRIHEKEGSQDFRMGGQVQKGTCLGLP